MLSQPTRSVPAPSLQAGSVPRTISAAVLGLVAVTCVIKLIGFVEKQVIAYYFGSRAEVDAFFVALSVPTLIFLFIRELVEPAFLPLFVRSLREGREDRGWQLFSVGGACIILVTVTLAVAAWTSADTLAGWLAPGLSASTRATAARLIRVMVPGAVCLGLSALTYITLNGYRRFVLPASGDLIFKAVPVFTCVLLAPHLGVLALAVGVLIGSVGRLVVHGVGLVGKLTYLEWPARSQRDDVREMLILMSPLVVGVLFSQISELADNYFASGVGEGGIAARNFARKIVDLPILLLPYTLSVVLFPHFAHLAVGGDSDKLYTLLGRSLRALAMLFAGIAVGVIALAEPLVTLLLERGAFDAGARLLTAWPLQLYALGLVAFATEAILVPFYFALKDTFTAVAVGIVGVALHIVLCAVLIAPLGVGGVALSLTISKTVKTVVLGGLLGRKRPGIAWGAVIASAVRITLAAAVAWLGLRALLAWSALPGPTAPVIQQAWFLARASLFGGVLYFGGLALVGAPERALMKSAVQFGWRLVVRGGVRQDGPARHPAA